MYLHVCPENNHDRIMEFTAGNIPNKYIPYVLCYISEFKKRINATEPKVHLTQIKNGIWRIDFRPYISSSKTAKQFDILCANIADGLSIWQFD